MNRKTHNHLAKLFFPDCKMGEIDRVNAAIDNPDKKMIAVQRFGGPFGSKTAMDFFGLSRHGHRATNHTVDTAVMAAMLTGAQNAPELAMTHLLADRMSNYMNDMFGVENKEIAEALFNHSYVTGKTGRKRRRKQMFF